MHHQIENKVDFETFFALAPRINPNVSGITGLICGYPVEDIEDNLMQRIRYLDKLVDELARGKPMEKDPEVKKGTGLFVQLPRAASR